MLILGTHEFIGIYLQSTGDPKATKLEESTPNVDNEFPMAPID
jgi:hypothetical protein